MIRVLVVVSFLLIEAAHAQMASRPIQFQGDSVVAFFNPDFHTCIRDYHEVHDCLPDSLDWNGKVIKFFDSIPNAKMIELTGQFLLHKRQGKWMWFYRDGATREIRNYKNGLLNGQMLIYDQHGVLTCNCNLKNGELDGPNRYWNPNEEMWVDVDYKNGDYDRRIQYSVDSLFVIIEEYNAVKSEGITSEYGNGKLIRVTKRRNKKERVYENGKLIKVIDFREITRKKKREKRKATRSNEEKKKPYERGYGEIMPNFSFDSVMLRLDTLFYASLLQLRDVLRNNPNLRIDLAVHLSSEPIAHRLDQIICSKMAQFLITEGVDPSRIVAKGYSNIAPLYSKEYLLRIRNIKKRKKLYLQNTRAEWKVIETDYRPQKYKSNK